jgi:hypothetical protein
LVHDFHISYTKASHDAQAMELTGLPSKKATVELVLRDLVEE